jgi:hypothetical protein
VAPYTHCCQPPTGYPQCIVVNVVAVGIGSHPSSCRMLLLRRRRLLQVQAERTAWQLAEELGLDVVTILPNFVLVRRSGCRHCGTCISSCEGKASCCEQ